ncbi:MAG: hypothetical protein K9J85_06095 [Desulfobacteraceae bacterium]|nr:hypothetical protein [Desulfobacteraceae bacterium]
MHDHSPGNNHHDHHHGDHEDGRETKEMPMPEKLKKMVSHWLKHNADHAETHRRWAQRAREAGMEDVSLILESVAKESQAINKDLEKAGKMLEQKG